MTRYTRRFPCPEIDPDHPGYGPTPPRPIDARDIDYLRGRAETVPEDWRRWFVLGWVLLGRYEAKPAADAFQRTVALAPDNGLAQYLLGLTLAQEGRPDEALDPLRVAMRLRPDDTRAWRLAASILSRKREFPAALPLWLHVVRTDPDGDAWWHIARGLCFIGREREAIVALEEALRLKPNHVPVRKFLDLLTGRHATPGLRGLWYRACERLRRGFMSYPTMMPR